MKILMVAKDASTLRPGTGAFSRMEAYRKLVDDLRIVSIDSRGIFVDPQGLRGFKPDLVTAQDPFETGLLAIFLAWWYGASCELQVHTDFLSSFFGDSLRNKVRIKIGKWTLPRADCIRVVSKRIKASLAQISPDLASRARVLPIAVDFELQKAAPIVTDLRKKYPGFKKRILMASRLTREKDISLALRVFPRILSEHPSTALIIVGEGPFASVLKNEVVRLGIEKNVFFEPWSSDLPSYYKTADLYLLTSLYEGYSLALLEAATCECQIVSSDVGCVGYELDRDSIDVFVPHDEESLHSALRTAIQVKKTPHITEQLLSKEQFLKSMKNNWHSCS